MGTFFLLSSGLHAFKPAKAIESKEEPRKKVDLYKRREKKTHPHTHTRARASVEKWFCKYKKPLSGHGVYEMFVMGMVEAIILRRISI